MKKLRILSLLLLGVTCAIKAQDVTSSDELKGGLTTGHTFFWARPQFQDAMPEKVSLWRNDRALARDCGWAGALQIVPFGGKTTKKMQKKLAQYFMFDNKVDLTVSSLAQDDTTNLPSADINPIHFNIQYNNDDAAGIFESTISFRPRQSVVGAGFDYIQYFGWNDCCERKWWGEVSFPVVSIRNDVHLTETITRTVGTPVEGTAANMVEAFTGATTYSNFNNDNAKMNFGKIAGKQGLKKTGVADVEIKIGYDYVRNDCSYLYSYLGVLAPTGRKPTGEFVFEPTIGENRQVGVLMGGSGGYQIWSGCDRCFWFDCDIAFRYLIPRNQTRSFDLKNRPWSRYMMTYADADDAINGVVTPGINIFTRKLKIHPHFQFDLNSAFVYESGCGFQAEVGYNTWARQGETARLDTPWVVGPAIVAIANNEDGFAVPVTNGTNIYSNIGADIQGNNVTIADRFLIQASDLDLTSATHPACLTQMVYGTVGYSLSWCWPVFVGVGASYEFTRLNTALNRWNVWGKFGISL